jgi:agmatinase
VPVPTLLGIPYDAASSFLRGSAAAPPLIRDALWSDSSNSWTELGVDIAAPGALADAGDVMLLEGEESTAARQAIEDGAAAVLAGGGGPISLGGDHSITYPLLRAVRRHHPRLTILHVDAHSDLYDEFGGDRYSHACPFARILEERLADRLVQVGIRAMTKHLREQVARFGVEVIEMRAWGTVPVPAIEGPVYLSIDLDGLDPAFAPGVSHREPGGLSVRDVVGLIHELAGRVVAADVVEYNPAHDIHGVTAMVAAKLVKELAGVMPR